MVSVIPDDVKQKLEALPKVNRSRLLVAPERIARDVNIRQSFVTQMVGQPGVWRLRKGDWRILYRINHGDIEIMSLGHRKKIYR